MASLSFGGRIFAFLLLVLVRRGPGAANFSRFHAATETSKDGSDRTAPRSGKRTPLEDDHWLTQEPPYTVLAGILQCSFCRVSAEWHFVRRVAWRASCLRLLFQCYGHGLLNMSDVGLTAPPWRYQSAD
ncbi:hypothetical protein BDP81DRAFT_432663 [Colletotrichum phormii]|uniref:Secreted protein n=1 Tax=Colletotrichum phormii TaxID=359342 RepID=A0AAI9ZPE3_9PEZI|nr:uncharacterized protein BDP81DRAFT_432663 [Colletotrichum phormii]KAK1634352.1 hypothetical protein BDP81DRAFT_432663 [Colletotrichum phormii]